MFCGVVPRFVVAMACGRLARAVDAIARGGREMQSHVAIAGATHGTHGDASTRNKDAASAPSRTSAAPGPGPRHAAAFSEADAERELRLRRSLGGRLLEPLHRLGRVSRETAALVERNGVGEHGLDVAAPCRRSYKDDALASSRRRPGPTRRPGPACTARRADVLALGPRDEEPLEAFHVFGVRRPQRRAAGGAGAPAALFSGRGRRPRRRRARELGFAFACVSNFQSRRRRGDGRRHEQKNVPQAEHMPHAASPTRGPRSRPGA